MFRFLATLRAKRRLLREFVARDLRARYVGSSMGFFWSVLFPLVNLAVYMFVFRLVLGVRFGDTASPKEVAIWMLVGITVWVAFAETISRTTNTLVENSNLIQKVVFPSEILPSYLAVSSLVNMAIGLPIVMAAVAWFAYLDQPQVAFRRPPGQQGIEITERIAEDRTGVFAVVFTTRAFGRDVVVPFEVSGSATEGEDYRLVERTVTIPVGAQAARIPIELIDDGIAEGEETVRIQLGRPKAASLLAHEDGTPYDDVHVVTIVDPPAVPPTVDESTEYQDWPGWSRGKYRGRPLRLGLSLVAIPLLMLLQGLFAIGLGSILATLNLFLRDTYHLVGVFLTVWMFATPIFYPAELVEKSGFGWIPRVNPMHWLISCYRDVVLVGRLPNPAHLAAFAAIALVAFALGSTFFVRQKPRFPDLL